MGYLVKTTCENCGKPISRPERNDGLDNIIEISLLGRVAFVCKGCYEIANKNIKKLVFNTAD
jgi:hypothetical protein